MSKYYSNKEIVLRYIWLFIQPVLFRYSPRLFYSWRNAILRVLGAKIGKSVKIYPSAIITFPWLLEVNDRAVISWGVKIYNLGRISIGEKTVISQFAHLCGGTHDTENPGFKLIRSEIEIGNMVWIAADAFIGPDVHIGDNAIVGARAVVIKNVEAGTIVAGNPAKVIGVHKIANSNNRIGNYLDYDTNSE
jgi:putative colanic acid biosynthesis acetyltransferase WcaF